MGGDFKSPTWRKVEVVGMLGIVRLEKNGELYIRNNFDLIIDYYN